MQFDLKIGDKVYEYKLVSMLKQYEHQDVMVREFKYSGDKMEIFDEWKYYKKNEPPHKTTIDIMIDHF